MTKQNGFLVRLMAWVALMCCLHVVVLSAHVMPQTAVMLDFHRDGVAAQLVVPLQDLSFAVKMPLVKDQDQLIPKYGPMLKDYVLSHIHPTAPDGRPWSVELSDMVVKPGEQTPDLTVHLWMRPPAGAPLRKFTLNYDVVVREVVSHKAFVFIRNDWNAARFHSVNEIPPFPEAIGLIRYLVYSIPIDRTQGSFWHGFGVVMTLGMSHIAGGLDHLLFLIVLLLPAPLLAVGNRWGGFRGMKPSFVQLFKIVTAFTLGHSLTLLIGGFGWLRLPGRPVEILIAVSILVSAVHAVRPWFAGWEPWVAGGFGLVHGLAFASSIAGFGFSPWHMAMTILGFNSGYRTHAARDSGGFRASADPAEPGAGLHARADHRSHVGGGGGSCLDRAGRSFQCEHTGFAASGDFLCFSGSHRLDNLLL